jgi:hypothetical protein
MLMRCFWPPERLMPFSPISVSAPPGSTARSCSRLHAYEAVKYMHAWAPAPGRFFFSREGFTCMY